MGNAMQCGLQGAGTGKPAWQRAVKISAENQCLCLQGPVRLSGVLVNREFAHL